MHVRRLLAAAALVAVAGCSNPFGRHYEYEEQLYLDVDGGATVVVDSSLPALIALRGVTIETNGAAGPDRDAVRRVFESAGCTVASVARPWTRDGRRFVQVQIRAADVRTIGACAPLAWSHYDFERLDGEIHFKQIVGAAAGADPGATNWTGEELIAFKLHLPSKITQHNVKRLDGSNGDIDRGNILTYEQRLTDRRAGRPLDLDVHMNAQSILYRALWLFVGAFAAAVVTLVAIVLWTRAKGKARARRA